MPGSIGPTQWDVVLVRRCSISRSAQAASKEWQRKNTFSARMTLISVGVQALPDGSVKWVPLSVSTVWIL